MLYRDTKEARNSQRYRTFWNNIHRSPYPCLRRSSCLRCKKKLYFIWVASCKGTVSSFARYQVSFTKQNHLHRVMLTVRICTSLDPGIPSGRLLFCRQKCLINVEPKGTFERQTNSTKRELKMDTYEQWSHMMNFYYSLIRVYESKIWWRFWKFWEFVE